MTSTTTRSRPPRRLAVIGGALVIYLGTTALFVAFASSMLGASRGAGGAFFGERVAIVELEGVIVDVDDLVREIKAYRDNAAIRAVVIRINSPGGAVAPTQELYGAIRRLREAGKPVVASLGSVAASGGYYVAVAADQIYANPGTLTGSIGVVMQMANLNALMKKVGVEYVVVKAGQFKDLGNFARPMTVEERRVLQALLDDVHGQFIGAVADGRKLERGEVQRFADGRVFSGSQAKALHMIDALGGLEDAIDGAATLAGLPKPPKVIGPRRRFSVVDLLRNQLGLAGFETLIDAEPLERQAAIPGPVFVIELEVGFQTDLEPLRRIALIARRPVDSPAQKGRHLLLEGGEHGFLVREIEVKRALGKAGRLHNRTNGRGMVAVTLEDSPRRLEQLAPAYPLPLGHG